MKYTTVKPFIKWAGRKSQLLDEIGVFLFQKQKIIYLGNLLLKEDESLYRESIGKNILFCCEIVAYHTTDIINTFEIMLQSNKELLKLHIIENDLSGTYVDADDYFYKLSQFPYPLPSNCIKKYDFCKLTPGESKLLMSLIVSSNKTVCIENESFDNQDSNKLHIIDMSKYLSEIQRSNNSVLSILLLSNNNYVVLAVSKF